MRKGQQPPWIIPDELWTRIEPLLPVVPRRADHPGRKRLDDRKVLCGILFVLYTGIPWEFLPQQLRFGSGMTCWRRLRDWHAAAAGPGSARTRSTLTAATTMTSTAGRSARRASHL